MQKVQSDREKLYEFAESAVVNLSKLSGKALIAIIKSTAKEMKDIKKILDSKVNRYMFITCTASTSIMLAYLNYKLVFLSLFSYFVASGTIKTIKGNLETAKTKMKIKNLNKKYKEVRALFNNNIDITEVKKNRITLFSREATIKDYENKKQRLEMYFNREIAFFKRNKNFKYTDIVFYQKTNFKRYYKFQDYLGLIDKKEIKNMYLPILLGINEKEEMIIKDLAEFKHLFINGESGGGKSSIINCIIQSLMVLSQNNIYILIDLKGGAELSDYKDYPNIIVVYSIKELHAVVKTLEKIMEERLSLIRNTRRCKDVNGYMERTGTKLNNIVCVIDEIASIRLSGYDEYKCLENSLLEILQKGRVANVFCIGATQKPSGEQINTNLRAGYLQNISFQVKDRYTQQQTKVLGTDRLQTGEFKSTFMGDAIVKGFLIRDTADVKRKLPECNRVFDDLEHKLIYGKEFIIIKEKSDKINNHLLHKLLSKINKGYPQKLSESTDYRQLIKTVSKTVVERVLEIKKLSELKDFSIENNTYSHTDNYINYLNFIFKNNRKGRLPKTMEIEKNLGIGKTERINYLDKAYKEELLIRKNERVYLINLENERWNKLFKGGRS